MNSKIGGVWDDVADIGDYSRKENPKYCPLCGREKSPFASLTRCGCSPKKAKDSIFQEEDVITECPSCDIEGTGWNPLFRRMDICMDCPRASKRQAQKF